MVFAEAFGRLRDKVAALVTLDAADEGDVGSVRAPDHGRQVNVGRRFDHPGARLELEITEQLQVSVPQERRGENDVCRRHQRLPGTIAVDLRCVWWKLPVLRQTGAAACGIRTVVAENRLRLFHQMRTTTVAGEIVHRDDQ